jgi:hypothetical protein
MDYMFAYCIYLAQICVSDSWNISNVTSAEGIFAGEFDESYKSSPLVGGNGTKYYEEYIKYPDEYYTIKYAVIDKAGQPGYLTDIKTVSAIDLDDEDDDTKKTSGLDKNKPSSDSSDTGDDADSSDKKSDTSEDKMEEETEDTNTSEAPETVIPDTADDSESSDDSQSPDADVSQQNIE